MSNNPQELVLGTAVGYGVNEIYPFVHTLRKHYQGAVALLVHADFSDECKRFCHEYSVTWFPIAETSDNPAHIQWARYGYYKSLANLPKFQQVERFFITDVRDVIFQLSPFEMQLRDDIELFVEHNKFHQCEVNTNWFAERYSVEHQLLVKDKQIICSGTIRCNQKGFREFITKYTTECNRLQRGGIKPWDQSIVNFLFYTGELANTIVLANGIGSVYTLHAETILTFSLTGRLLNQNNIAVPVVHQWDRSQALTTLFRQQIQE